MTTMEPAAIPAPAPYFQSVDQKSDRAFSWILAGFIAGYIGLVAPSVTLEPVTGVVLLVICGWCHCLALVGACRNFQSVVPSSPGAAFWALWVEGWCLILSLTENYFSGLICCGIAGLLLLTATIQIIRRKRTGLAGSQMVLYYLIAGLAILFEANLMLDHSLGRR